MIGLMDGKFDLMVTNVVLKVCKNSNKTSNKILYSISSAPQSKKKKRRISTKSRIHTYIYFTTSHQVRSDIKSFHSDGGGRHAQIEIHACPSQKSLVSRHSPSKAS